MATNLHKKEMDQFTSIRSDITPKQRSNNIYKIHTTQIKGQNCQTNIKGD